MNNNVQDGNKIFRVKAQGDTLYIRAPTLDGAKLRLVEAMGVIPERLLSWSEVKKLPKGEEFL